jgi:hypothetical protein
MSDSEDQSMTALKTALIRLGRTSLRSPAAFYDAWVLAETEASLALMAWRSARRGEKAGAYAVYAAALEAEALAADLLREHVAAVA